MHFQLTSLKGSDSSSTPAAVPQTPGPITQDFVINDWDLLLYLLSELLSLRGAGSSIMADIMVPFVEEVATLAVTEAKGGLLVVGHDARCHYC